MFGLALLIPFILSGCGDKRLQTVKWIEFEPVYMSHEEFENAVTMEEPRELEQPGNPDSVVEDDLAYVTLRDSRRCRQTVNRLEVVDVKDRVNPKQIASYEMTNPHGLGIDNGTLFIGEGKHGLRVLDASNPQMIKHLRHFTDINSFDVIPLEGVLMVTGDDGIVQYDYSDIDDLKHLSTIPVNSQ